MTSLQNQTAIITDASRGIGKGIATVLGHEDTNVVIPIAHAGR